MRPMQSKDSSRHIKYQDTGTTHNTMNNCMLPKQNHFSRRADKPFSSLPPNHTRSLIFAIHKLLQSFANRLWETRAHVTVVGRERDGPRLEEGALEIVDEVHGVFDTDAEPYEVLREAAGGAGGGVDGCMATGSLWAHRVGVEWGVDSRHDAGHADERVDASEADADTPEPSRTHNSLTKSFIACSEA
jgi:hypothetical protein